MPPLLPVALLQTPGPYFGLTDRELATYAGLATAGVAILVYVVAKLRELPHNQRAKLNPTMEPMQVEELMQGTPPIIVDLRTAEEFRGRLGHIRGAINVPFKDLKDRIDEIRGTTGNRPIILVDRDDRLAHAVVPIFRHEGFEWFYVLKGGMKAWAARKLPVYR